MTEVILPVPSTTVGQTFHLNATVKPDAQSFTTELVDLGTTEIYLRLKADFERNVVERNAALEKDAGWGKPETSEEFPFTPAMTFDLVIKVESTHFNILINGNSFCIFRHRSKCTNINAIRVAGDLNVNFIEVSGVTETAFAPVGTLLPPPSNHTTLARYSSDSHSESNTIEKDAPVSKKEPLPTGPGPPKTPTQEKDTKGPPKPAQDMDTKSPAKPAQDKDTKTPPPDRKPETKTQSTQTTNRPEPKIQTIPRTPSNQTVKTVVSDAISKSLSNTHSRAYVPSAVHLTMSKTQLVDPQKNSIVSIDRKQRVPASDKKGCCEVM